MAPELAVYTALQKLLQPTETAKFAANVLEGPRGELEGAPPQPKGARRSLGIISNTASGIEEAALIVFRRPTSPLIVATIPIYADFKLSIQQTDSAADSSTPRSRFLITFGSLRNERFSVLADDLGALSDLIAEVRRLASIAESENWKEGGQSHGWLAAYTPHDADAASDNQTLARFDSAVSSAYSMRISSPMALRTGLGAIDWNADTTSVDSPDLRESEAAEQRSQWVVNRLKSREDEFTLKEDIKIWTTTYNVNDTLPKGADLSSWLAGSEDAELLVFGFQEFDLSTEAMVRYSSSREDQWREAIEQGLGGRAVQYEKLVGALMIVYVRKESAKYITSVSSNSLATGIMGLMANKGAVAIRLRFKDSFLTFVNSHLAAFTNQVEARNTMFHDTTRYLGFPLEKGATRDPWLPNLRADVARPLGSVGVYDTQHLIWLGDLNYRLDLPRTEVLRMAEKEEWEMLLKFDQLGLQKKHNLAFADFEEAEITFGPTFKFDVGKPDFDTSEKQRTPSWTDRIQWLSWHKGTIESLHYKAHHDIMLSDHRPVSSLLKVQVCTVIEDKRSELMTDTLNELNSFENDALPEVKIHPSPSIEFGTIAYLRPETRSIEVVNVGSVIAEWSFVLRPGATALTAPWLSCNPTSGIILPNQKSLVNFTINVDATTAPRLNFAAQPEDELSDLLILSIDKRDLFLSVSARHYARTCFANSLVRLGRMLDPIREMDGEQLETIAREADAAVDGEGEERMSVVRPAFRMLEFLAEYGLEEDELFMTSGDSQLVDLIREALDTGGVFPLERLLGPTSQPAPSSPPPSQESLKQLARLELEDEPLEGGDIGIVPLSPEKPRRPFITPPIPRTDSSASTSAAASTTEQIGVASMASCLLRWLEALPEPLVTFKAYSRALRVERREEAYAVVRSLPAIHANLLIYIIGFLKVYIAQLKDPKERIARMSRLAVVFSTVILRPDPSATPDSLSLSSSIPRRRQNFILLLLEESQEDVNLDTRK